MVELELEMRLAGCWMLGSSTLHCCPWTVVWPTQPQLALRAAVVCYSLLLSLPSQELWALLTQHWHVIASYTETNLIRRPRHPRKDGRGFLGTNAFMEDDGGDGFACKATTPCHLSSSRFSRCAGSVLFQTLRDGKRQGSQLTPTCGLVSCQGHESSLTLKISWVSPPSAPTKADLTSDKLMNVLRWIFLNTF